ncbi:MAG: hypothetical protein PHU93_02595 [Candidatus Gracilibacteria bacterium]|nr:hypothetical protein [Candidatus Gracilibacteria bacterium]
MVVIANESITYYSGACISLPSNAVYFNTTTSYSVSGATTLNALTAGYTTNPLVNTCQYKCNGTNVWNGSSCIAAPLYTFTSHTFTNCGVNGMSGPSLSTCRSSYGGGVAWAQDTTNNYLNMTTNGIQLWTVPSTGTYRIDAYGSVGGSAYLLSTSTVNSGQPGARIRGDFTLTRGQILKLLIGQTSNNTQNPGARGGGGGGGSYVVDNASVPMLIAGGGGGAGQYAEVGGEGQSGQDGTAGTRGSFGAGGVNGGGGGASQYAGGGAGWYSNGTNSGNGKGGNTFNNGGEGGVLTSDGANGGFGGGGGTYPGGGGGGGYSGGGGGDWSYSGRGGGGGSYNTGTNQVNTTGANTTSGYIIITKL